ncbi:hypothetical protein BGZ96_003147 [Linnemannia gamsii]|uniref:F-box domain-containing protein n=1 Tax=Linnemannia gamsii TaxID=64522 RepID=A0ABQ7K7X9_9FUNG|nr:hypothetical protein BGZ96_003147 [Linnemannia gamsii]
MPPFSDPHSSFLLSSSPLHSSATTTFFSIPELVSHLGYFLTAQDIALFRATNKTYYKTFHNLFWRTINLLDDGNSPEQPDSKTIRLLDSRPATRSFALNLNYIELLSCQSSFLVHHFYGLNVLLDVAEYLKPGVPFLDVSSREFLQDLRGTAQELLARITLPHGTVSKRPDWVLPFSDDTSYGCLSAIPAIYTANAGLLFPPMTNLTRLECVHNSSTRTPTQWQSLPSRYLPTNVMTTMFLCWVLYFNKGLTHIKFDGIDLTTLYPVRVMAQTLSGLAHLKTLELSTHMTPQEQTYALVGEYLLFHCSHTLETFHLKAEIKSTIRTPPVVITPWYDHTLTDEYFQRYALPDWTSTSFTSSASEMSEIGIPRMPMPLLKSLRMPDMPESGYMDELCPVLENCSALESLVLPTVGQRPLGIDRMLNIIKELPLRLKRLTVDYPKKYDEFHETPGSFIDILKPHTLESLSISFFKEGSYTCLTSKLLRHSETLCDLTFDAVESLYSSTILDILSSCRALKKLIVRRRRSNGKGNGNGYGNDGDPDDDILALQSISIAVTHAIAKPWICLGISHLEIPVMLDWIAYTAPMEQEEAESRGWRWVHEWRYTQANTYWTALRTFYQQIGALHQLEVLDLKACVVYPGSSASGATWSDVTLPGMLLMPYQQPAKTPSSFLATTQPPPPPGFLDMLGGLTKLRELRGSVRVDLPGMESVMRLSSYRWIATHWPALKVAEFLLPGYQSAFVYALPPHITWLYTERPFLKLAADKKPDKKTK